MGSHKNKTESNAAAKLGYLDERAYKPEMELADRYQAFTAEILRLSLLGIAVFGFLFKEVFLNYDPDNASIVAIYGGARAI